MVSSTKTPPTTRSDYQETSTYTLEWSILDLKTVFEGSKDDERSAHIESEPFCGGRWRLYFYPSAGRASSCSLYLAAVPTAEELRVGAQNSLSQGGWPREGPRWSRKGPFKFTFEFKSLDGKHTIGDTFGFDPLTRKEFTHNIPDWGYESFGKRLDLIGDDTIPKSNNGFKIVCSLTCPMAAPAPTPLASSVNYRSLPSEVIDSLIELFDDPTRSDVVFRIPSGNKSRPERRIYANKKILARRSSYFRTMFDSGGFLESSGNAPTGASKKNNARRVEEDEDLGMESDSDADTDLDGEWSSEDNKPAASSSPSRTGHFSTSFQTDCVTPTSSQNTGVDRTPSDRSPSSDHPNLPNVTDSHENNTPDIEKSMTTIVVKDAQYLTFRALLFALYTDIIVFAPLASTYRNERAQALKKDVDFPYPTRRHYLRSKIPTRKTDAEKNAPFPCSPKSLYRIADKLDLQQIKDQAFEAIKASLTAENVASELFSSFASLFPEVRKAEMAYLLEHWDTVSHSDTMTKDFNPFRDDRPGQGNKEIFVTLLQSLQPKPPKSGKKEDESEEIPVQAGTRADLELDS
jgi:hypothetical protein